ncbi:MAG: hypothetical protein EOS64_24870 [Mesorhizobium sp.]|nr:MAG: hypothetical protein EOS64_24870 [Mesorhizobium sp.]
MPADLLPAGRLARMPADRSLVSLLRLSLGLLLQTTLLRLTLRSRLRPELRPLRLGEHLDVAVLLQLELALRILVRPVDLEIALDVDLRAG